MAGTPLIAGLVFSEGHYGGGCCPLLIPLGRVKHDISAPGRWPPFIREFPVIGDPVGW